MNFNKYISNYGQLLRYGALCIFGVFWFILFLAARGSYQGNVFIYDIFSLVFLWLLGSAISKGIKTSYLFLAFLLWMGFWFKVTVHLIFTYPYVEPVGQFDGTANAWDEVLRVATIAAVGVIGSRLLYHKFPRRRYISARSQTNSDQLVVWYESNRRVIWILLVATVLAVNSLNLVLGIHQIGMTPRTYLIWPFNALIGWMANIGCSIMVTTVVWWELSRKKGGFWASLLILLTALISSVSVLSRGVFLFQSIPQLVSLYRNRRVVAGFTPTRAVLLVTLVVGMLALSIASVTTARAYLYPNAGGFTTASQIRLTRLEVLEGGIGNIQKLIDQGEDRASELQELVRERAALEYQLSPSQAAVMAEKRLEAIEKQRRLVRIEILDGGIGHIRKLIAKGEDRDAELRALIEEKTALEVSSPNGRPSQLQENGGHPEGLKDEKKITSSAPLVFKTIQNKDESVLQEFLYQLQGGQIKTLLQLATDRWIGVEGLMAVTGYPEKSFETISKALLERRAIGTTTFYQEVSHSIYRYTDASSWQFASLPGAAAFLYYSGSWWVVMLGMAFFTTVMLGAEDLIVSATENPLLASLIGFAMANTIAQFGVTPRQDLPHYFMIGGVIFLIWFIQSTPFRHLLGRLGLQLRETP